MLMVVVFVMLFEVVDFFDFYIILFWCVGLFNYLVCKGKWVMGFNLIEIFFFFDIIFFSLVVCFWFVRICYYLLILLIWIIRMI